MQIKNLSTAKIGQHIPLTGTLVSVLLKNIQRKTIEKDTISSLKNPKQIQN